MKNGNAISLVLLSLLLAATGAGAMDTATLSSATTELKGGTVYTVSGTVGITGTAGKSALTAKSTDGKDGRRVVVNIPAGCALTVRGGNADGQTGAGAGILLPDGMTLYVTGGGKLTAIGGSAANGENGYQGEGASRDGTYHKAGRGTFGSRGGGGAGAGIGGCGGAGGARVVGCSSQHASRHSVHGEFVANGHNGPAGKSGAAGSGCGVVYVLGDVTVIADGGKAGYRGSVSEIYGSKTYESASDNWFAGPGGPGGPGGGGGAAQAIGGGGGGGGGGGCGGCGSYVVWDNGEISVSDIQGGRGGQGGNGSGAGGQTNGESGRTVENYEESNNSTSGSGGKGGAGGSLGTGGQLFALPTSGLATAPYRASGSVAGLVQESFLTVAVTLDLGLKDKDGNAVKTAIRQPFACRMADIPEVEGGVNPRIRRAGYRFAGFWTAATGGTCVYGPDYKPTMVLSPYTEDLTLYARWEVDSSILSVTSSGDAPSALDVYGNTAITLRDAVKALADDPLLVGADGRRRIVFELAATDTVVRLSREIEIASGMRAFEINGLYGLDNGVTLVAAAGSRHLRFAGSASDKGVFSLVSLTFEGGCPDKNAGGAILVDGGASVAVDACAFFGNRTGKMYNGGAIGVESAASELLVSSTTFAGNSAYGGGAVSVNGSWALFVNTTFSANVATGTGGAVSVGKDATLGLLACTFAGNAAKRGPSLACTNDRTNSLRAVNTIFADKAAENQQPVVASEAALAADWCSMGVDPAVAFAALGAPVTQVVAGVTHVVYSPLGGSRAGNEDAAEIYHDAAYSHVLAVGRDGRRVVLSGDPDLAKIPFVGDQLSAVRTAPTRGAVRLAVGTEPVSVELDGVLCDAAGNPRENAAVNTKATVFYDGGETAETNLVIKTAEGGVFGLSVPVDGSDGQAHNVTGIKVDALGTSQMTVATAPYALTAASVDLIGSNDYVPLVGDGIAICNVAATSVSVTNSFDARAAESFTAGSLKGFKEIDLEHVTVAGGALEWFGGVGPAAGKTFANLGEMTVSSGAPAFSGTLKCTAGTDTVQKWTAGGDGFFQLQARCLNVQDAYTVRLDVLNADGKVAFNVTPAGAFGPAGKARRLLWTVPVRRGQAVRLTLASADGSFELSSVTAQFIYFGVVR